MRVLFIIAVALATVLTLTYLANAETISPTDRPSTINKKTQHVPIPYTKYYYEDEEIKKCFEALEHGKELRQTSELWFEPGETEFKTYWLLYNGKTYRFHMTFFVKPKGNGVDPRSELAHCFALVTDK